MRYTLVIGNKCYSSWSLRPWLALEHAGIPFDEVVIPLGQPDTKARLLARSPTGRVPVLVAGSVTIAESIAILETLAERHPGARLWPEDPDARALARAASAEMHSGFADLRRCCPYNLKRRRARTLTPEARADVDRVTALWRELRARAVTRGDFLLGDFGAVDCMFAPVAGRIRSYEIPVGPEAMSYVEAIEALPAFVRWRGAALEEPWSYSATDTID